ncbi:MAG: hydroxymethylbilane synthase [Pyrinomonadaceae bacterium]|nr:hydroxymethylbilane synthase [Pyrinomonadaceae bacterium]
MKHKFIIGSRGSELALWQTNYVKATLEKHFPELKLEIKIIKTTGDKMLDVALAKIGDKGLFTKQIETALLNAEIDLAVHSLKDLQTVQPAGLIIGAVSKRELPNDVLISKNYRSIDELPEGAKVATGSLRRKSQLLHYRPDLQVFEIRGNVPTRIKKFEESNLDALILAFAGVHRLNLDAHISQIIPFETMLPAVGQGAMAVELREDDADLKAFLGVLNDAETEVCVNAERSFLRTLEGGCQVPIGANAVLSGDEIYLEGMVGNLNGSVNWREKISGAKGDAEDLGERLARILIAKGANELLEQTREKVENSEETVF